MPAPSRSSIRAAATRQRILDTAESLFAEEGIASLSMRSITSRARVNLAAVHYHFGSKQGLVVELVRRRLEPLNHRRLALLEDAIARARPGSPGLEQVIDAYIEPLIRVGDGLPEDLAATARRFTGHIASLPADFAEPVFQGLFRDLAARFHAALLEALPQLSPEDLFWRMHLALGPVTRALAQPHLLGQLSGGACDGSDIETAARHLRGFICAGLRAPAGTLAFRPALGVPDPSADFTEASG